MAHLITGYAGYEHIKSADAGAFNAAVFGSEQYVLETREQFAGTIIDNNTVRIQDGDGLMYGRHFRIDPGIYEDVTIETGTSGMNRVDLICMTYEKNGTDETEMVYLEVIKGKPTAGTAAVPSYTDGNILEGATKNQMPLYKVTISGVVLSKISKMFDVIPTYKTLAEKYEAQFNAACENQRKSFIDAVYPIGSVYMSVNNVNPGGAFGGTWVAWGSGRVPVGVDANDSAFNSVEKTGGEKAHTLTVEELPVHSHGLNNHTHSLNNHTHSVPNHTHTANGQYMAYTKTGAILDANADGLSQKFDEVDVGEVITQPSGACTTGAASGNTGTASGNTTSVGSGTAHNNLQPYITCYMWKRTA